MNVWELLGLIPLAFIAAVAVAAGWHGGCILGARFFGPRCMSNATIVNLPPTLPVITVRLDNSLLAEVVEHD